MGQIKFKWFYTELVEAYLRATVRGWTNFLPTEWLNFTTQWIEALSEEDRDFVQFVFSEEYYHSTDGVASYPSEYKTYFSKREWLFSLEKNFAIAAGLISEDFNTNDSRKNKIKR